METDKEQVEATEAPVGVDALVRWWNCNIMFFSFGKYWKGVYIHFLPNKCHRVYWSYGRFGYDNHPKPKYIGI